MYKNFFPLVTYLFIQCLAYLHILVVDVYVADEDECLLTSDVSHLVSVNPCLSGHPSVALVGIMMNYPPMIEAKLS
ncbi:hypothetical protein DSO57_1004541 [Entomophthora muscae]|uniref:Uncharacterized protein n=1 Tax=Entomophthora muscae TaxID=34485 RepID=A0ACC2SA06_9FUNG|nr:hypothetical protein DSO57_1004541 [Entomophthora muscae]